MVYCSTPHGRNLDLFLGPLGGFGRPPACPQATTMFCRSANTKRGSRYEPALLFSIPKERSRALKKDGPIGKMISPMLKKRLSGMFADSVAAVTENSFTNSLTLRSGNEIVGVVKKGEAKSAFGMLVTAGNDGKNLDKLARNTGFAGKTASEIEKVISHHTLEWPHIYSTRMAERILRVAKDCIQACPRHVSYGGIPFSVVQAAPLIEPSAATRCARSSSSWEGGRLNLEASKVHLTA